MRIGNRLTILLQLSFALLFILCEKNIAQQNRVNLSKMILIRSTTFEMGIDNKDIAHLVELGKDVPHMNIKLAHEWFDNETPKHKVYLDDYFIDAYEVTNRQFKQFIESTGYKAEGNWENYYTPERDNFPVVGVTWNDATAFAKWAGKRLPTEAEWEYACKGGTIDKWFWWGNTPLPEKTNYRSGGESFFAGLWRLLGLRKVNTKSVGSYKPNGYGLYDMLGNVSEWCKDKYKPYPNYSGKNITFPINYRVLRGGNWESPNAVFIRTTYRKGFPQNYYSYSIGFRCAKSFTNK